MVWGKHRFAAIALVVGVVLAASPSAPAADDGEEIVGVGQLTQDAESGPALLGTAVGVGIGLPLTILGYPEHTAAVSQDIVPVAADTITNAGPIYGGLLESAQVASKDLAPILNPSLLPLMRAGAQALDDNAPG